MNVKKLISVFMATLMLVSMLVPLSLTSYAATGGVKVKLNNVMKEFPPVSKQGDPDTVYFTVSGKPSKSLSSDDCYYPSVAKAHGYNWSNMWSAYSCCGFVHFVFRYIFGVEFTWTDSVNTTTHTINKSKSENNRIADLDKFFKSCKVGDAILFKRPSTHYAIFVSYDPQNQRVLTYDCGWDKECAVKTLNRSLSGMKNYDSITRYRAKNYDKIDTQYAPIPESKFKYEVVSQKDKTIKITGYTSNVKSLSIPTKIDGYTVVGIAESAFKDTALEKVSFPNTLKFIGKNAFAGTPIYKNSLSNNAVYINNCLLFVNSSANEYVVRRDTVLIADGAFEASSVKTAVISTLAVNISDTAFNSSLEAIKGYKGSAAETYANKKGLKFIPLDDADSNPYALALGDINGDSKHTIVDAKLILSSIAGVKMLDKGQADAADINKDGKVSLIDAKWILQVVADLRKIEVS